MTETSPRRCSHLDEDRNKCAGTQTYTEGMSEPGSQGGFMSKSGPRFIPIRAKNVFRHGYVTQTQRTSTESREVEPHRDPSPLPQLVARALKMRPSI
jgi:hypothetical protein